MNTDIKDDAVTRFIESEKAKADEAKNKLRFKCDFDGCTRRFDSPKGLMMHRIRGHISPWSTTGNFGTKKQRRKRRLEKMRIVSKATRIKNIAKGLTGSGYERKTSPVAGRPRWKSKAYRSMKYREQVERYHAQGLNAHGQPFKNNKLSLAMQKSLGLRTRRRGKSGRMMPYVFPVPETERPEQAQPTQPATTPEWIHAQLHFCPHCGEKLTAWKKHNE